MNQGGGTSIKMSSTAVKGQMKGLLKGLRYISQMFDEEEDNEIQIGFPTDVKHLAHIGCEDAKTKAPSWMTEFKETQEQPEGKISEGQDNGNNSDNSSIKGDEKKSQTRKSRQRSSESQSATSSPPREEAGTTKPSRRHHSSETSRRSSRQSNEDEENNKPPKQSHYRRKTKTTSEEKDKDSPKKRSSRPRRSSKAGSLTDASFSTELVSGSVSEPPAQ